MVASAQPFEDPKIERHGGLSTLSVHTFRPLDAIATTLEEQFGIRVGAEDPVLWYRGDLLDISTEISRVRPGTLVPARWGFEVQFAVNSDGAPKDPVELLKKIVTTANGRSHFAYRLDDYNGSFSFVPTRTYDEQGISIPAPPLLDRLVTIPLETRRILQSAALMAADLSKQTGLRRVNCCQAGIAGYPWGMETKPFGAINEPAREVLRRLGLDHWHVRCGNKFCFIDQR